MTNWYMNFCAPFIPNDPTINFHRLVQAIILLCYTTLYILIHLYYTYCCEPQKTKIQENSQNRVIIKKREQIQSQSGQSSISPNKEGSWKLEETPQESSVCMKKTKETWAKTQIQGQKQSKQSHQQEIKQYFTIVYGHFAISMGVSIMYTPYAEQTLAALIYTLLTILLLITSSKNSKYGTRFVWIVMTMLLIFILTCGLLEIGQSNWDILSLDCFSNRYVSLYD